MINEREKYLTSIVILTSNQLYYTRRCIESVFQYTSRPYELIFVDNASTDKTFEFLVSCECSNTNCVSIKVIANKENAGFAQGCNQGLSVSSGKYLLLLNNDVVVTPNWLPRLINGIQERNFDLVGPMSNYVSGPQLVTGPDYDLYSLKGLNQYAERHARKYAGRTEKNWRLAGFCILFNRYVLDKIGGLDHRYNIGNFEDDDFCIRSYLAGFKGAIVNDCYIHHFGGQTFLGNKIDYNEQLTKNWEIFKRKWNIPHTTPYGSMYKIPLPIGGFDEGTHVVKLSGTNYTSDTKTITVDTGNSLQVVNKAKTQPPPYHYQKKHRKADKLSGGTSMPIYDKVFKVALKHIPKEEKEVMTWILERIVEYSPHHGKSHHELGLLYYELDELAKAQSHLHQAVRFSPEDPIYFKDLGDFYHVVHKDVREALQMYEKALSLKPNDSQLLLTSAHFCVMEQNFDLAREYYRRVLAIDPNNTDARDCLQKLENNESSVPSFASSLDSVYDKIKRQIKTGDLDDAIAGLDQILSINPDHAQAHNDRGILANKKGDTDTALVHLEKACKLDPQNPIFLKRLADFYWNERKDAQAAMERYVAVLQLDSEDLDTILNCGRICLALGKNEDALDFFDRVQEIDPLNEDARQLSSEAKAENAQISNVQINGEDDLYRKAQSMAEKGRLNEAIDCLLQLLVQSPQNALYHNDIGVLYYKAGEKNKAMSCYEQAVQLEPCQPVFQKNLADFYLMEQGRFEEAMKIYVKVLEDNPQDIDCLLATGLVCINLGKNDDANIFFQRVLEIEPWNQSALQGLDQLNGDDSFENLQHMKKAIG